MGKSNLSLRYTTASFERYMVKSMLHQNLPLLGLRDIWQGKIYSKRYDSCLCATPWFERYIVILLLFGVLRHFQHCTGHIMTGSWKGRGNQYIQLISSSIFINLRFYSSAIFLQSVLMY